MKLLLVDDEVYELAWLRKMFVESGDYDVYTALSGRQALACINEVPIDIMVSDIRMPGISGLTLAEQVQKNWPKCRIIFLSGYATFDYIYQANQNNVRYVLKTEDDDVILEAVNKERLNLLAERREEERLKNRYGLRITSIIDQGDKAQITSTFDELGIKCMAMEQQEVENMYREILREVLPYLAERNLSRIITQVSHPEKLSTWQEAFNALKKVILGLVPSNEDDKDINQLLKQIHEYIEEHLSEELSLNRIATYFYYNPSYFSRLYSRATNESIMDYIKRARINRACEYLIKTNKNIQQITLECGFESSQYFAHVFRVEIGCTPSEYRKQSLMT